MDRNAAKCPHCREDVDRRATRCPHCAGEIRYCSRCKMNVAAVVRDVWKGALRGGKQRQVKCGRCSAILEGTRW